MERHLQKERRLSGLALSAGCAVGKVCLFNENRHSNLPMYRIAGSGVEREVERVHRAIDIASGRLDSIRREVQKQIGAAEAEIFVAHKMILQDPELKREIISQIEEENVNAESAVAYVLDSYEARLQKLDDEYIKARATDFGEIKRRLLDVMGNMRPGLQCDAAHCQKGRDRIIVAEELTPSLTVDVDPEQTMAFVTERGGINSHAAILARALGIPAVSGLAGVRELTGCGAELLVNGDSGEIILWPEDDTVSAVMARSTSTRGMPEAADPVPGFRVMANISMASDIEECIRMKAEGIGLYRTEFEIIAEGRMLSEDELCERYVSVARSMAGKGVIFRLFDIGSDKTVPFLNIPEEENPSLGLRGARLLLGRREVLATQARALARTSEGGRVHVMYPMIIDVEQFRQIRREFIAAVADIPHGTIRHGVMFEVPSACLLARELLEEADFASVGTNDLTQYLFAVDRENDLVSYDYNPDRQVFWDLIRSMSEAARDAGKPLSVCGELAGYQQYVSRLMEAGIDAVSVSPRRIPEVRSSASRLVGSAA